MRKLYLLPCLCMLVLQATAQQTEGISPTIDPPQQLVHLHQGDVFTIRAPYSLPPKRSTVKNVIRVAGIAAMAYGTEKIVTRPDGKTPVNINAKNSWLLPLGAGMTLTADQLAGRKKDPGTFITYQFYDKDMSLVNTRVVKVTNRQLKKSGGIAVTAVAPQDGFLHVSLSDDVSFGNNVDLNNGLRVEVQSNKATPKEPRELAASPVSLPLAVINAGRGALPEKLGTVGLAVVHPSPMPMVLAPAIKRAPTMIFKPSATTAFRSRNLTGLKDAPVRPAVEIPGRGGNPGSGLPDPFILFPPVDRGIFNPRFDHGDLKEDDGEDDDDGGFYGDDGGGGGGGGDDDDDDGDDDDDDDDDSGDDDDDSGDGDVETLPPVYVYPDTPNGITQTQPISTGMSYYDAYTGSYYQLDYSASVAIDNGAISGVRGGGVTISPASLSSVVNGVTTVVSLSAGNFTCVTSGELPGSSVTVIWTCTITETVQTFVAGNLQLNYSYSFEAAAQQYVSIP